MSVLPCGKTRWLSYFHHYKATFAVHCPESQPHCMTNCFSLSFYLPFFPNLFQHCRWNTPFCTFRSRLFCVIAPPLDCKGFSPLSLLFSRASFPCNGDLFCGDSKWSSSFIDLFKNVSVDWLCGLTQWEKGKGGKRNENKEGRLNMYIYIYNQPPIKQKSRKENGIPPKKKDMTENVITKLKGRLKCLHKV